MELRVIRPDESCFKKEIFDTLGHGVVYGSDRVEYTDNGILVYYRECALPKHGFPFPEAVAQVNVCKKILKILIKYVNPFRAYSRLKDILYDYSRLSENLLINCMLKDECLSPVSREVKKFMEIVLGGLNLPIKTADIFAHILEYDDAYRFFFQDLAGCFEKKDLLKFKTYRLAQKIINERCINGARKHIKMYTMAVAVIMLYPKIRRAVKIGLEKIDYERFKMDDYDRYWVLNRNDWNFMGKTWEERLVEWNEANGGKEPVGYKY